MMKAICPYCQASLRTDDQSCGSCGARKAPAFDVEGKLRVTAWRDLLRRAKQIGLIVATLGGALIGAAIVDLILDANVTAEVVSVTERPGDETELVIRVVGAPMERAVCELEPAN